jgi:hypothetical protein
VLTLSKLIKREDKRLQQRNKSRSAPYEPLTHLSNALTLPVSAFTPSVLSYYLSAVSPDMASSVPTS